MTFKELIEALKKDPEAYGSFQFLPNDSEKNVRVSIDSQGAAIFKGNISALEYMTKDAHWRLIVPKRRYYLTVEYEIPKNNDLSTQNISNFFENAGATVLILSKQGIQT